MAVPYGTYGTSIIRRLFTTLAYKTKILTANWIVAERLILPVRVVKIGSDNRPASTTDIADIQTQLAQTANDPNLTIVTHHNFEYDWYGAAGKILQVTQEMEHIDKELLDGLMLNQALLNGEMCLSKEHEVLTAEGYRPIEEISKSDSICVWDDTTQTYHYEHPEEIYKYESVQDLYEIKSGDKTLFKCTADHNLVVKDFEKGRNCENAILWHSPQPKHIKITARDAMENGACLDTLMKDGSYHRITDIHKVSYGSDVYCFKTSTGFFVAKYNDIEFVSSNSGYQSAQVGVETLIRRIESWRATLAEWIQERIFKPIAEMQGFVDEEKSKEVGETVFLYPTIEWNDLELKDKTQYHQMLMQLHDKQVISTQTLLEEIGLDYDQEVKRQRYEQAQLGPAGAMLGGGAGAGGMGGMGMGGGGAGGMPGGATSPEQMGMPGAGMEPMGDMGGGGAGGAGAPMAAGAGGKITKKGKGGEKQEEEIPIPMMPIKLTKIEQKMAGMMDSVASNTGISKDAIRMQYPIENPKGGKPFTMDFAIPGFKLNVEADGEVWHSSQEQVTDDQERDYILAQRGWTILRFDDKSIEEAPQQVEATINSYVQKALAKGGNKQASVEEQVPGYLILVEGKLKSLVADAYYEYLDATYPSRRAFKTGKKQ
jgi:very-short-patch-repair endonuclease